MIEDWFGGQLEASAGLESSASELPPSPAIVATSSLMAASLPDPELEPDPELDSDPELEPDPELVEEPEVDPESGSDPELAPDPELDPASLLSGGVVSPDWAHAEMMPVTIKGSSAIRAARSTCKDIVSTVNRGPASRKAPPRLDRLANGGP